MDIKERIIKVTDPPISTFFHNDVPLSIIYDDVDTHPWIFSNYIQLYSINNVDKSNPCFIDFFHSSNGAFRFLELTTCPWILFERISRTDVVNKWGSVLEFTIEKILQGKYIGVTIDAQKIKNYLHIHMHNLFIYGFNDEKKVLFAGDHYRYGFLTFEEVSYEDFEASVMYPFEVDLNWGNLEGICTFSKIKRKHKNIYNLDIRKIICDIESYLLHNVLIIKGDYYIYGIECYDNLVKYYQLALQHETECDLKGIHMEISHKIMMILRLEYLNNNGYDVSSFHIKILEIKNRLKLVLSYVLKYNITKKACTLEKSIQELIKIKIIEQNILNELVEHMLIYINKEESSYN